MKKYLLLLSLSLTVALTSCGVSAFSDPDAGIDGPYGHLPRTELVAADTAGKGSAAGTPGAAAGQMVIQKAASRPGRYFRFMFGPPLRQRAVLRYSL